MKKRHATLGLALVLGLFSANQSSGEILPHKMGVPAAVHSQNELVHWSAEEKRDLERYPNMMQFVKSVRIESTETLPAGNEHLSKSKRVFRPDQEMWTQFFRAAVADKLTNIRAFALIGRELKKRGITVYGLGADYESAVRLNKIDLGLSMPAKNIAIGVWEPDSNVSDPEFLLHVLIVYTEPYVHQFPDEVLPANLKIGYGLETHYMSDGERKEGHMMKADLYYGQNGLGFKNVQGVGGQKRGFVGFMQKLLFFLPDAVHSMMINERENAMITEALVNTKVEDFETREAYRIRYQN
ncbi:MAG: hypothetical protein AB1540_07080 [Bdellovibrionota bacterium]